MRTDGSLTFDTKIDTSGFRRGTINVQKQLDGLSGAVKKLGSAIASVFRSRINTSGLQKQLDGLSGATKKLGLAIASVFAVKQLVEFGREAIKLGSDLQEVQNVVDVTFTTMADKVDEFAKNAAVSAGLSETMAKQYVGTFGAMAKSFGFAEKEAFDMSTALTQLAGDVASFYNLSQEEAYYKLKSVFTGETETLKDLGVVMTQTALDQYALANGIGKTTQQMTEQEKVALRYRFVLEQLSGASGDFLRTSDGWANQIRVLKLQFDSLKATIGQGLINVLTPVLKLINTLLGKLVQLAESFKAFTELITGNKATASKGAGLAGTDVAGAGQDTVPKLGDDYNTAVSGAENLASATEDATEATKEAEKAAKGYLSPLDTIHKIGKEDIEVPEIEKIRDTGGAGNIASVPVDYGELAKGQTAIDELSDKFSGLYDLIKKKDWEGLGRSMASGINAGLRKIYDALDWNKIGPKITKVTDAFTGTVNSMVENIDWDLLGRDVGRGIDLLVNTFNQLTDSKTGINFEAIGRSLSTALRGMLAQVGWRELGNAIGNWFMISWNTFKGFVDDMWRTSNLTGLNGWQELGRSLAEAVTGLFEKVDPKVIGESLAGAISGAFETVREFALDMEENGTWDFIGASVAKAVNTTLSNINWKTALSAAKNLGDGIAKAVNKFISKTNFKSVGSTVSKALETAIQFALSLGMKLDFKTFGDKLADSINAFFKKFPSKKAAKAINVWIKGALKTASTLLKETDFKAIGDKIGEFLVGIDLSGILGGLASTIWEAIKGAFKTLSNIFESAPLEASLISAFAILKFTGVGKSVAGNIASAIGDSIETSMINSGFASSLQTGIAKATTGAVAAFAEFSTIKTSFEDLASGTSSLIDEIGKIGGTAVAAGVAMTTVFGFPAGLIATAFAGLMGAFAGVISANDELARKMKEEEEISRYGQTISDMADNIDRSSRAIRDRIEASDDYIKTAGVAEASMAQNLADQYFKLADKQGRTNEETEEMKTLASLLVDTMPELSQYYNDQTGLLDTTKGKIDELIQSRLQEIQLNAVEEQLTQAYKDQTDALAELGEITQVMNDKQAEMNSLKQKYDEALEKSTMLQKYEELEGKIENCQGDTSSLIQEQERLEQKLTSGGTEEFPTFQFIEQEVLNASQDLQDFQGEYEEVKNAFITKDEDVQLLNNSISRYTDILTSGMKSAADGGISAYKDVFMNDTTMESTAYESAKKAAYGSERGAKEGLDDKKESVRDAAKDLFLLDAQRKEAIKSEFSGYAALSKEGYTEKLKELESGTAKATRDFADNGILTPFTGELGINSPSKVFEGYGENIVSGLKNGIDNLWDSFSDWWGTKVSNILDKFKGIKKSFEEKGNEIISGIQTGVSEKWSELSDVLTGKKNDIVNTFSNIREEMKNIGSNIINGIIDGLNSMWNNLTSWVGSIKDALTFNISSPFGGGGSHSVNAPIAYAEIPALANAPTPYLAQGAVIPPNAPFAAVLGDQKNGRNLEAPESLIRKIVREESGRNSGSNTYHVHVNVSGRELLDIVLTEGELKRGRNGSNPFALGVT